MNVHYVCFGLGKVIFVAQQFFLSFIYCERRSNDLDATSLNKLTFPNLESYFLLGLERLLKDQPSLQIKSY